MGNTWKRRGNDTKELKSELPEFFNSPNPRRRAGDCDGAGAQIAIDVLKERCDYGDRKEKQSSKDWINAANAKPQSYDVVVSQTEKLLVTRKLEKIVDREPWSLSLLYNIDEDQ